MSGLLSSSGLQSAAAAWWHVASGAFREGGQPLSPAGCPSSANQSHQAGTGRPLPALPCPPIPSGLSPTALSTEVTPTVGGGEEGCRGVGS